MIFNLLYDPKKELEVVLKHHYNYYFHELVYTVNNYIFAHKTEYLGNKSFTLNNISIYTRDLVVKSDIISENYFDRWKLDSSKIITYVEFKINSNRSVFLFKDMEKYDEIDLKTWAVFYKGDDFDELVSPFKFYDIKEGDERFDFKRINKHHITEIINDLLYIKGDDRPIFYNSKRRPDVITGPDIKPFIIKPSPR